MQTFSHSRGFGIKEILVWHRRKPPVCWMNHLKCLHHYYTEFTNPSLDRSLSVHVITCNTVWQILKSRCPSILSTFAARGEVCSHEAKGGCHRYPTATPLQSHRQIDSDVQKGAPSMILFTCLIGLKWVAGRGGYGKRVGWGLLVGTRGEGHCWGEGWEHWGARGWQVERKRKHSD